MRGQSAPRRELGETRTEPKLNRVFENKRLNMLQLLALSGGSDDFLRLPLLSFCICERWVAGNEPARGQQNCWPLFSRKAGNLWLPAFSCWQLFGHSSTWKKAKTQRFPHVAHRRVRLAWQKKE